MKAMMFCAAYCVGFAAIVCDLLWQMWEGVKAVAWAIMLLYCLGWLACALMVFAVQIVWVLAVDAIRSVIMPKAILIGPV